MIVYNGRHGRYDISDERHRDKYNAGPGHLAADEILGVPKCSHTNVYRL